MLFEAINLTALAGFVVLALRVRALNRQSKPFSEINCKKLFKDALCALLFMALLMLAVLVMGYGLGGDSADFGA